jgi:dynein regulatory complex protein 1
MQILEKCMEDMKAVFRLNEEKLDFNKKVLHEREKANTDHKKNLKERERKLGDMVRAEKSEFEKNQKQFQRTNY